MNAWQIFYLRSDSPVVRKVRGIPMLDLTQDSLDGIDWKHVLIVNYS